MNKSVSYSYPFNLKYDIPYIHNAEWCSSTVDVQCFQQIFYGWKLVTVVLVTLCLRNHEFAGKWYTAHKAL